MTQDTSLPDRKHVPFGGCFAAAGSVEAEKLVFVGLPNDSQSSFQTGAAEAPARIRVAYDGRRFNSCTESGLDLEGRVSDLGDWEPGADWAETAGDYEARARPLFSDDRIPFFAGGDHAVTIPITAALEQLGVPVHVVQFDAHPDLYPEFENDPNSHACVGTRFLEMPHVARLTQIGIRAMTSEQSRNAQPYRGRLRIVPARELAERQIGLESLVGDDPIYVTLDVDVFDPGFAPGVAHPVPGGLNPRQVLNFLQALSGRLVGMDVVEVLPERDRDDLTAILAARILHEAMGVACSC